jgi:F-type H+-transporting ATPase subunit delta
MKSSGVIVKRYASAFSSLAEKNKVLVEFKDNAKNFLKFVNESFVLAMSHPNVTQSERLNTVEFLTKSLSTSQLFMNSVQTLIENGRIALLEPVLSETISQINLKLGIASVQVVSAQTLSGEQKSNLSQKISQTLKKDVVLEFFEDKELISGFILKMGNSVIDASVATRLLAVKESLSQGA